MVGIQTWYWSSEHDQILQSIHGNANRRHGERYGYGWLHSDAVTTRLCDEEEMLLCMYGAGGWDEM